MALFCEERFAQDFQFDRLKQTIHTVMRSAVITPKSFYYFIARYSYFNGYASAVISGLAAHDNTRRAQNLLHLVGDYAQLSGPERDRITQVPTWLTAVVQDLVSQTPGDDIASLVRALGFHAASEMMGDLEQVVLDRVVCHDCPWCYLLINRPQEGRENHCQQALNALNRTLDHRPELPEQIKAWVYEGYQRFIDLQQRLFYEIYRESLELQYGEPGSGILQGEIPGQLA
jgi:hypothetical protein